MDDTKKDWIKHLLGRWFSSGDVPEEEPPVQSPSPEKSSVARDLNGAGPELKVPPIAGEVARKLGALKSAMELGDDATSRLGNVRSAEDMLLYSYEVIFRRFMSIQEIGLASARSSLAMDAIHRKYRSILEDKQPRASEIDADEKKRLEEENQNLRIQLRKLKAEFIKKGVISERELLLDKEIDYLRKRMREQASQLEISRKRNEAAMAGVEMTNTLLAKNGLLNARLANQERLLRTLTAESPKHRETLAKLEILREENTRLRDVIRQCSEPGERLEAYLGADAECRKVVDGLLVSNRGLKEELVRKDNRLDAFATAEAQTDVAEAIERLSNENYELTTILEAGRAVRECSKEPEDRECVRERVVELIKVENQRLHVALKAKEEQLKVLTAGPANRPMMKAIMRLKDENGRLSKAIEIQGRLSEQWEEEKKQLQIQARRSEELMKKNLAMKTRLQNSGQTIKTLQTALTHHQELKKEYSTVLSRYEAAQMEILNMKKRLSKITAQYDLMMKEYESIFGQFK